MYRPPVLGRFAALFFVFGTGPTPVLAHKDHVPHYWGATAWEIAPVAIQAAGLVGLLGTLWFAARGNRAALKAAKIALRSERAWLRVEAAPSGDLIADTRSVHVKFDLLLRNVGKAPATVQAVHYWVTGTTSAPNHQPQTRTFNPTVTVFPDDAPDKTTLLLEVVPNQSEPTVFAFCVHYTDLLTGDQHWVERRFEPHMGQMPIELPSSEHRLSSEKWGFHDKGLYRIDQD